MVFIILGFLIPTDSEKSIKATQEQDNTSLNATDIADKESI